MPNKKPLQASVVGLERFLNSKKSPFPPELEQRFFEGILPMKKQALIKMFVEALNSCDFKKIHDIAIGVEMLKQHEEKAG